MQPKPTGRTVSCECPSRTRAEPLASSTVMTASRVSGSRAITYAERHSAGFIPEPARSAEAGRESVRRDAAINRERLVRAAEQVFAERGPAATLGDVANAAAVGPATLYRRFANKDALVQEVLSGFFRHLIDVAVIAEQSPPEAGLDVFLRTVGVELAAKAGLSAPVWGELAPEPLVEELRRRSTELLRRAQRAGVDRAGGQAAN